MNSIEFKELKWKNWLAKEKPWLAVLVLLILFVVWLFSYSLIPNYFLATILSLAVFFYLSEFFLPTEYCISQDGVWKKIGPVKITKKWELLRSFYTDKNGVLLSPFSRPTRLDTFRGIYLRFGKDNKGKIVELIKLKISKKDKNNNNNSQNNSIDSKSL